MTYVGAGGSYTMETTYKYVGYGAGEFEAVAPAPSRTPLILAGLLVVVLVVVLAVLLVPDNTSTTFKNTFKPTKDCLLWGDPHVQTFDNSFPSFLGEGEFYVVRSNQVSIQARFMATPFTNGLAATHQIAVGGAIMGGSKFSIGPLDNGEITCDDQPILQGFPSSAQCGPVTLTYDSQGKLVDDAQAKLEKRIVHVDLPDGTHLQIMRWANHLNVRVTMQQSPGQDGVCGNFNGNAADDSSDSIMARLGGRVPVSELLFRHRAQTNGEVHKTIADCDMELREKAMKECKAAQPNAAGELLDTCIFDVCFGGEQYAAEDGLSIGQHWR